MELQKQRWGAAVPAGRHSPAAPARRASVNRGTDIPVRASPTGWKTRAPARRASEVGRSRPGKPPFARAPARRASEVGRSRPGKPPFALRLRRAPLSTGARTFLSVLRPRVGKPVPRRPLARAPARRASEVGRSRPGKPPFARAPARRAGCWLAGGRVLCQGFSKFFSSSLALDTPAPSTTCSTV
jgi:hypothetical protein